MTEQTLKEAIMIKERIERYEKIKSEISFLLKEQRCIELATMSIDRDISSLMWEVGIKEYEKLIDKMKSDLKAL